MTTIQESRATFLRAYANPAAAMNYMRTEVGHNTRFLAKVGDKWHVGYFPELEATDDDPITDEQRRALFARFLTVFHNPTQERRHKFTAVALGPDAPVSWSRDGGMTVGQAKRLIQMLDFIASSGTSR